MAANRRPSPKRSGSRAGASKRSLSRDPWLLRAASIERMDEAQAMFERGSWVMAMYLSGLAVESLLQAFAHRDGAAPDARHDLGLWLDKCPRGLVDVVQRNAVAEWSALYTLWDNALRYMSEDGLVAHLRGLGVGRRMKGGRQSLLKRGASQCLETARVIHNKGLVKWPRN